MPRGDLNRNWTCLRGEGHPDGKSAPQISQRNPPQCARCHGTDPKPIWEEYDRWPGAYGEEDDALIDFDDRARFPAPLDNDNQLVARHRQHLKEFRQFVASKDNHPRYKWLKFPEGTDSPVAPYIPRIRSGQTPLRPNLQLTHIFSELNGRRVAGKLSASGEQCFRLGGPLIASLLIGCDGIQELKPRFAPVIEKLRAAEATALPLQPAAIAPALFSARNPGMYKDGRVLLMQIMGLSDFDWTPARHKRQWEYFQGFKDTSDDILAALWPQFAAVGLRLDPYDKLRAELKPDYYSYDRGGEDSYGPISARESICRVLGNDLDGFDLERLKAACAPAKTDTMEIPPVVHMCMSCHNGSGSAPRLPLDDRAAILRDDAWRDRINERLNAPATEGRMPPDRPLTTSEYRALAVYLGIAD